MMTSMKIMMKKPRRSRRKAQRTSLTSHHRQRFLLLLVVYIIIGMMTTLSLSYQISPIPSTSSKTKGSTQQHELSITTFNILASVHRSMPARVDVEEHNDQNQNWRESDKEEWWQPRAIQLAKYIATKLSHSDVIVVQEWWNNPKFECIFDQYCGHIFDRVTEKRPGIVWGSTTNQPREDGMACLVNKNGKLELVNSSIVLTGPSRIGQIIHCREKVTSSQGSQQRRNVIIGNTHLSFPGGPCPKQAERKQTYEAHQVARAITKKGRELILESTTVDVNSGIIRHSQQQQQPQPQQHLELMAGDFNSNSCAMAATRMESSPYKFVNCMSASAEQTLSTSIGGLINLGVTHRNHLGEQVSVDHIMARFVDHNTNQCDDEEEDDDDAECCTNDSLFPHNNNDHDHHHQKTNHKIIEPLLRMGYFDSKGTKLLSCRKRNICLEGDAILSDHRPVTARLYWPPSPPSASSSISDEQHHMNDIDSTMINTQHRVQYIDLQNSTLHPLESPWNS